MWADWQEVFWGRSRVTRSELWKIELYFGLWYKSIILISALFILYWQESLISFNSLIIFFILYHLLYIYLFLRAGPVITRYYNIYWIIDVFIRINFVGILLYLTRGVNTGLILFYPLVLISVMVGQPNFKGFLFFGGTGALNYALINYLLSGPGMFLDYLYWRNAFLNGLIFLGGVMVVSQIIKFCGLASTDSLTGLGNRRHFNQALKEEIKRAEGRGSNLSLIILDLDQFRVFNENLGHSTGDKILIDVARIIEENLGFTGYVYRCGGDDFGIILPGAMVLQAKNMAEKLVRAIAGNNFQGQNKVGKNLTASAGVSTFPTHCHNVKELLKKAHIALDYGADGGYNSVTIYSAILELNEKGDKYKKGGNYYPEELELVISCINVKDQYTRQHSERVAEYAFLMAKRITANNNIDNLAPELLWIAGMLHDLGKIEIPREVLVKTGPLTSGEWELMRKHPELALNMLEVVNASDRLIPIIKYHHERYDGSGYPDGLQGEEIPPGARILTIADAYDAMCTDRPYRPALSHTRAVEELKNIAGTHFDPDFVDIFINVINEIEQDIVS